LPSSRKTNNLVAAKRAVELLSRAVTLDRNASLQPWRIYDARGGPSRGQAAVPTTS
jgi:hypothetical protein